jgi:hypothetical protein
MFRFALLHLFRQPASVRERTALDKRKRPNNIVCWLGKQCLDMPFRHF